MPTVRDTAELLDLSKRIATMPPGDKLRVAATCIDAGKYDIAETIACHVVDQLRALRLLRNKQVKP